MLVYQEPILEVKLPLYTDIKSSFLLINLLRDSVSLKLTTLVTTFRVIEFFHVSSIKCYNEIFTGVYVRKVLIDFAVQLHIYPALESLKRRFQLC